MAKPSRASRPSRYLLDGFEVDVSSLELRDARGQRVDIAPPSVVPAREPSTEGVLDIRSYTDDAVSGAA